MLNARKRKKQSAARVRLLTFLSITSVSFRLLQTLAFYRRPFFSRALRRRRGRRHRQTCRNKIQMTRSRVQVFRGGANAHPLSPKSRAETSFFRRSNGFILEKMCVAYARTEAVARVRTLRESGEHRGCSCFPGPKDATNHGVSGHPQLSRAESGCSDLLEDNGQIVSDNCCLGHRGFVAICGGCPAG